MSSPIEALALLLLGLGVWGLVSLPQALTRKTKTLLLIGALAMWLVAFGSLLLTAILEDRIASEATKENQFGPIYVAAVLTAPLYGIAVVLAATVLFANQTSGRRLASAIVAMVLVTPPLWLASSLLAIGGYSFLV